MQDILSLNQLEQSDNLVFVPPGAGKAPFAYSDGESTERYLHSVLSDARDRSCRSAELQAAIIDWPSEYHLSSDRCNLLRPYDLSGVKRVLELGSGCGAISRYLGELGLTVDAVEGSSIRAELGKLRCQDLDNVRVINANYNDLSFPQGYYDLVLFVGVIEYAHKFHPGAATDREAAQRILEQAAGYIQPKGAVLVAIENRLGLKYMLGAHEDHYAQRYVGINDYVNSAGIATYSRPQWKSLIAAAGFTEKALSFPFPDYKIPSVVLSEHYIRTNAYASNHLEGLVSRDYYAPIKPSPTETVCWQAASQGGFIGDLANSFCLLMGNDAATIAKLQSFDFCHGPGSSRRDQFAVTTRKASDSILVQKDAEQPPALSSYQGVTQRLSPLELVDGNLLSGQWLRCILIYVRREEFDQMVRDYFQYLTAEEASQTLMIDLLPINIIERPNGEWLAFDQEWDVDWPISKEYVLFRALLTFITVNWIYLRDFLSWLELQTVRDFIEYGFHANQIHLSENIEHFIEMEDRFQLAIARVPAADVTSLLETVFDFSGDDDTVYSSVHWQHPGQQWHSENKSTAEVAVTPQAQQVEFSITPDQTLTSLRFDPFDLRRTDDIGFYRVEQISLKQITTDSIQTLWSLDNSSDIARACSADSAIYQQMGEDLAWLATTDFPKMIFSLDPPIATKPKAQYTVCVTYAICRTKEYAMAYRQYLVESRSHQKKIDRMNLNLTSLKSISGYLEDRLKAEETRANRLQGDLRNTQREIETIKQSKPFLLGTKIVGVISRLRRLVGR